jgi:ribonuclease-3
MSNLEELQDVLQVKFNDVKRLELALIHRSYVNENADVSEHNERLEFLGDAVLEIVVTEHLYRTTNKPEGELTNWRSALVCSENLAMTANGLGLGTYLKLSRGEELSGGREKTHILANAYEAVIGAIYLDSGLEVSRQFIERTILSRLEEILAAGKHIDSKSRFQELSQEHLGITPEYRLEWDKGPDHAKEFGMGVYINDELIATGKGQSKQSAEQDAAKEGLLAKGWE